MSFETSCAESPGVQSSLTWISGRKEIVPVNFPSEFSQWIFSVSVVSVVSVVFFRFTDYGWDQAAKGPSSLWSVLPWSHGLPGDIWRNDIAEWRQNNIRPAEWMGHIYGNIWKYVISRFSRGTLGSMCMFSMDTELILFPLAHFQQPQQTLHQPCLCQLSMLSEAEC